MKRVRIEDHNVEGRKEVSAAQIAAVFNRLFRPTHLTELRGGGDEPLYLPATASAPAQIIYTKDYPASALHEAAHWCLAGDRRRRLVDYGYWYVPPPRTPAEQRTFFRHELRVQALECLLAAAVGLPFRVSHDDPAAAGAEVARFEAEVLAEARQLEQSGLPERAARFRAALAAEFAGGKRQSDRR